jgi:hypothetical protein
MYSYFRIIHCYNKEISYTITDGKQTTTSFTSKRESHTMEMIFDPEEQKPLEYKLQGWQAIFRPCWHKFNAIPISPIPQRYKQKIKSISEMKRRYHALALPSLGSCPHELLAPINFRNHKITNS